MTHPITIASLQRELSVGGLGDMLEHLWFAVARRPATPLHFHVAMGREIMVADRMDLHLLYAHVEAQAARATFPSLHGVAHDLSYRR